MIKGAQIKTLADWNEDRVEQFCRDLRNRTNAKNYNTKTAPPATMRTRNSYRQVAKTFDLWLYQKRRQPELALRGLTKEKDKTYVPSRQRPPLNMAEIRKLWESTRKSNAVVEGFVGLTRFMLYVVAAATGLRVRELASLTPRSFWLGDQYPEVVVEARFTKNGREARQPVALYLVPVFKKWLAELPLGQPVFPGLVGKKDGKDDAG